jgi:Sel1 repeat-containing protein
MKKRHIPNSSRFCLLMSVFLVLALTTILPFDVSANDAKKAYLKGDKITAFNIWHSQAGSGDPEAQFNIGYMYENGEGTVLNLLKAVKWYELAARQNYPAANDMAKKARVRIRKEKAENLRAWLPKAEAGEINAQLAVSEILAAGEYTHKDNIEAMKWLILALETAPEGTTRNRMERFQESLSAKMSAAEIGEAKIRIAEWKKLRPEIYKKENE